MLNSLDEGHQSVTHLSAFAGIDRGGLRFANPPCTLLAFGTGLFI
jgi:hypothetical protein